MTHPNRPYINDDRLNAVAEALWDYEMSCFDLVHRHGPDDIMAMARLAIKAIDLEETPTSGGGDD